MNCGDYRERLFGGPRDPGCAEHEASCRDCAEWSRAVERQERLLRAASVPRAPGDLWLRVEAAIGSAPAKAAPVRAFKAPHRGRLAAAAAVLVAVIGFALMNSPAPKPARTLQIKVVEASPETSRALGSVVPGYDDVDSTTAMLDTLTSPVRPEGRPK